MLASLFALFAKPNAADGNRDSPSAQRHFDNYNDREHKTLSEHLTHPYGPDYAEHGHLPTASAGHSSVADVDYGVNCGTSAAAAAEVESRAEAGELQQPVDEQ